MLTLWLAASALTIGTLAAILPGLIKTRSSAAASRSETNIAIAREREGDLRKELLEGLISDAEYDAARAEIEQSLALDLDTQSSKGTDPSPSLFSAAAISALLPIAAIGIYLLIGSPTALNVSSSSVDLGPETQDPPDIDTMLDQMKSRLADRPDDLRGWTLFANALMGTGRYQEAVPAYRHLSDQDPANPEHKIRLADAIAMTQGGALAGEPETLITQALQLQPNHPQGLWLYGIAREQRGAFDEALAVFQRLAPMVANQPEVLTEVNAVIQRIQGQMTQSSQSMGSFSLEIRVEIDPTLAEQVTPGDTLFVFARVPNGPPMPVAAKKTSASTLPVSLELSDQDLLVGGQSLSAYPTLQIGVRVSKTGSANRSPGDLAGTSDQFSPRQTSEITVSISEQIR